MDLGVEIEQENVGRFGQVEGLIVRGAKAFVFAVARWI
jgi:hypothetical protein